MGPDEVKEWRLGDAEVERLAAAVLQRLSEGAPFEALVSAVAAAVAERPELSSILPRPRSGERSPDQIGPYEIPPETGSMIWDEGPATVDRMAAEGAQFAGAEPDDIALQAELRSAMRGPRMSRPLNRPGR